MPIASILIPVYNHEKYIARAVMSALNQTVTDIEVVIVDNKSMDNTFEICQELAIKDSRIILVQNHTNIGPVKNWKKAAELANSNFSKLLFSDDYIHPTFLEKTLPHLIKPNCSFVYTTVNIGIEDSYTVKYRPFIGDTKILRDSYIYWATYYGGGVFPYSPCSCISRTADLKRNLHTNIPGFESSEYEITGAGVDWLFHPLTALTYEYVQFIDEPLVFFEAHGSNLTTHPACASLYSNAKNFVLSRIIGAVNS